jgi:hypothetical protein
MLKNGVTLRLQSQMRVQLAGPREPYVDLDIVNSGQGSFTDNRISVCNDHSPMTRELPVAEYAAETAGTVPSGRTVRTVTVTPGARVNSGTSASTAATAPTGVTLALSLTQ